MSKQEQVDVAGGFALVLGGARSGKSTHAERLSEQLSARRNYIATAQAFDDEMAERIELHKTRRGQGWRTVEEPYDLPGAIRAITVDKTAQGSTILVDCLTLWLSNVMLRENWGDTERLEPDILGRAFIDAASSAKAVGCYVVAVSNEVGLGLVPETKLGRRFRDAQGRLNQQIAAAADHVVFVAAGLPLVLKGESPI